MVLCSDDDDDGGAATAAGVAVAACLLVLELVVLLLDARIWAICVGVRSRMKRMPSSVSNNPNWRAVLAQ